MTSLAARYAEGEHEQVWLEINRIDFTVSEDFDFREKHPGWRSPNRNDIEDVMRQTYAVVARNVDRLIERLPELGYRFESEAGRYADPFAPRQSCGGHCALAQMHVEDRFGDSPVFDDAWPVALTVFGELVGNVDLRQRRPAEPTEAEQEQQIRDALDENSDLTDAQKREIEEQIEALQRIVEGLAGTGGPEQKARSLRAAEGDRKPHPFGNDPVLSRLGDWDPLEVSFEYLAYDLSETEREMTPLPRGGAALVGEFAASFEHKAHVSGAINPWIAFPANRADPIVRAEGIELPFTTYLRRIFARGGFFGTPRPITRDNDIPLKEVELGIWLPEHPIFAELAGMMEPF